MPLYLSAAAEGASSTVTPTMRRTLFTAICFATLAAACWERYADRNDGRAYFVADGDIYRVELTGWRFPLVHDPLSLLVESTRRATLTMDLPRIEGVIDGGEIPVGPDKLRYDGRVVITNRKMQVDLYYNDRRPLSWNDEYRLAPTEGTR
jgi:hypothetical protein